MRLVLAAQLLMRVSQVLELVLERVVGIDAARAIRRSIKPI
jgi:hypothetical protein